MKNTLTIGQSIDVYRVDAIGDNYPFSDFKIGSFRAGFDYKGLGADILSKHPIGNTLYLSYNLNPTETKCTKVGRCIVTKVKPQSDVKI